MPVIKDRAGPVLLQGQIRPGKNEIQLRHIDSVVFQLCQMIRGLLGKQGQDLFNLFFLPDQELPELIVQIDNGGRLYEKSRAAGGLVMDNSGYMPFMLRFNGDAVSVAPHGHHTVLQIGSVGDIDHFVEGRVDPAVDAAHLPADLSQFTAGFVRDLFL